MRMNKRLVLSALCLTLLLLVSFQLIHSADSRVTFGHSMLKYGSSGKDVKELQGRLKFLGYYHGNVDGSFGYGTLQSVKRFQSAFGMKVDGLVGPKTKLKLWQATKKWAPGAEYATGSSSHSSTASTLSANHKNLSANDIKLMANAVNGEARGEPYIGQVAVAAVILNRLESPKFPNTISGIIFQPGAFTAVADGQIWLTPDASSKKAVMDAINGYDPTGGAIYYFNPATATSKWIWSRPQVKRIGKHIFCM